MSETDAKKTNETLALDVMHYAYRDTDNVLYTIDAEGKRIVAPAGTPALSETYQKAADHVAGFMLTFNKVAHLDEKERGMFEEAMAKGVDAVAGITDKVRGLVSEANERRKAAGLKIYGEDAASALGTLKDGAMLPLNIATGVFNTVSEMANQFGGVTLNEEQALAIGTAYASAAQVAQETGSNSIGDYLLAAIKFAVSKVCGLFKYEGDVWGMNKKDATWNGLLQDERRDNDHERVQKELEKLPEIGGVKTTELGILNRDNSAYMDSRGNIVVLEAADSTDAAPHTKDETKKTPENIEAAKKDLEQNPATSPVERSLNIVKDKVGNKITELSQNPLAATVGIVVGADITHGVARGTMSMMVGDKSLSKMRYDHIMRNANALQKEADAVRAGGKPIKNFFGKTTGHTLPDPVRADVLDKEAQAAAAKAAPKAAPFKATVDAREAMFGTRAKAFAESSSFFGKYDLLNRGGALFGKGLGAATSAGMSAIERGALHSTKMLYGWDAVQGVYAMAAGDAHGVTENVAQIGGGWAGAKYSAMAAARYLPGRFKMLAPVAGLVGFFGGRKAGEMTNNALLPNTENQNALPPEVAGAVQEMNTLANGLQAQGVNILAIKDEMAPALRTPATTQQAQADLLLQLQQCGAIPATMPPSAQVTALQSIQKMVQLQDQLETAATKIEENKEKRVSVADGLFKGVGAGMNVVEVGHYLKGGKILKVLPLAGKSVGRFIPWVGNALSASGDVIDGVQAFNKGDSKAGWHSTAKATGGLIGAIGVGAGAGALAGSPFFGLGAIPGAIIGGLAGLGGYYFGSKAGGSIADSITGYDENAPTPTTIASTPTKPSVEMDAGIAAAMQDPRVLKNVDSNTLAGLMSTDAATRLKTAQALAERSGYKLAISGAKVSICAVGTAPTGSTSTPPVASQTTAQATPYSFS